MKAVKAITQNCTASETVPGSHMAIKCTRRRNKEGKKKKRPKSTGATEDQYQEAYRPCVDAQHWELIKSDVFYQQSAATTLGGLQGLTHP